MTVNESEEFKKGARVCWRGDAADSGIITETSCDAVTIAWNNGQVASVHHSRRLRLPRPSVSIVSRGWTRVRCDAWARVWRAPARRAGVLRYPRANRALSK